MKISKQLQLLALVNGAALVLALTLSAIFLSSLRHAFDRYQSGESVSFSLTEIKATALAASRSDLAANETPQQISDADKLIHQRWQQLRNQLPEDQREALDKSVLENWETFRKNFDNAYKIFPTAPTDALSIPDRIYGLYIVPLNEAIDKLIAERQKTSEDEKLSIQTRIGNLLWIVLSPLAIAGAIVLVFQLQFGRRLRRRLEQISAQSSLLAQGDLRTRLPAAEQDEFGDMARHINHFVTALESTLSEVKLAMKNMRQFAQHVAHQNAQLEDSSRAQTAQLVETSRSLTEINNAVQLIAGSTHEASQSASNMQALGEQSRRISSNTAQSLDTLANTVTTASGQLTHLSQTITQIGNVSSLIREIANQTNLLALNAAIEAARAGEHGRGFAVVADEVRALSERTAVSTGRIEELLQQVWSASAEVVSAIRVAEERAEEGREQGTRIMSTLGEMGPTMENVTRMLDGIAASTEEHSAATASIAELVHGASDVAQQVAGQLAQASADADTLLQVANRLQASIAQFTVNSDHDAAVTR